MGGRPKKRPNSKAEMGALVGRLSCADIAKEKGVDLGTVYKWLKYFGIEANRNRGANHWATDITDEKARAIMACKGTAYAKDLTARFNVSESVIYSIWRYETFYRATTK